MTTMTTKFANVITCGDKHPSGLIDHSDASHRTYIDHHNHQQHDGNEAIQALIETLESHPLDLTFMAYGGFVDCCPISCKTRMPLYPDGFWMFWGNFASVSHVFHIVTNDPDLKRELNSAIKANLRRQQQR